MFYAYLPMYITEKCCNLTLHEARRSMQCMKFGRKSKNKMDAIADHKRVLAMAR